MKNDRITLVLEGLSEEEGRIRLGTFVSELQSLNAALTQISRDAIEGKPSTVFEVAEISYNSPLRMVLTPKSSDSQMAQIVLDRFERVAAAVTTEANLDEFDSELLEDFRRLARPVGVGIKRATLFVNEKKFELNDDVAGRVTKALAVDDECYGSIEGMLEQINIHRGANTFHVYPDVGPRKISCHFPHRLFDDAVFAVGRRVEVFGILKYRRGAAFPYQIDVSDIEAFPPEDELPDWEDLRGRAPSATGALSSEAFVRELRNGWE
ncbi:MAG: hypothetical protein Q7S99_06890 [Parvibaculum sp.]|nr:hypothetical protein [Parvibaculum sp.]